MRVPSRVAVAAQILTLLGMDEDSVQTSERMAGSIGANSVIVRDMTGMLRRAGLARTTMARVVHILKTAACEGGTSR